MADLYIGGSSDGYVGEGQVGSPNTPDAVLTEESSDAWWSGTQYSFVQVTRTIAALALSVSVAAAGSFTHNDEVPQQIPSDSLQASTSGQRLRQTPVFHRWAFTDDLPTPSVPSIVDEDPRPLEGPRSVAADSRVWVVEDDLPTPAAPTSIEEDYWWSANPRTQNALSVCFADDEWVPLFAPDEHDWALLTPAPIPPRTAVWVDDDYVPPPVESGGPAEGDGAFRQRAQQQTTLWRWEFTEDLPQQGEVTPALDDGDWWRQPTPAPTSPRTFSFADVTDFVPQGAVTAALDDGDGWRQPTPLAVSPRTFAFSDATDFVPPSSAPDGDASYQIVVIGDTPVGRVFTDDDWVPPASPQESDWQVWTPPLVAARPLYAPDLDNQIVPVQAAFTPIEEDWQVWTPALGTTRPLYAPDLDSQIVPTQFTPVEEDWRVWTPPPTRPASFVHHDSSDELPVAASPVAALDEGYWTPPTIASTLAKTIVWVDGDTEFQAVVVEADWQVWTPPLVPTRPLYAPDLDSYVVPVVPPAGGVIDLPWSDALLVLPWSDDLLDLPWSDVGLDLPWRFDG